MPKKPSRRQGQRKRSRQDAGGQGTRQRLLEIAGQVFADKGIDRATGKEICARAGANVAAINYHFGSFERLYAEVLCEAHRRLTTLESLENAVASADGPRGKLEAVIRLIVGALTGPISASWVLRVLGREIVAPSAAFEVLREREALPKFAVIHRIVAEMMGLPASHPSVARGCVSVMGPCSMLLVVNRRVLKRMFPQLGVAPADAEALIQHMVHFAASGLSAIGEQARREM